MKKQSKTTKGGSKPAAKPATPKPAKAPSTGKVLMALGAKGFTFIQAKQYAAVKKLAVNDNSIYWYLSAGRTGKRGAPAKLTEEQWAEIKKLAGPKVQPSH
jgi:hypothetical protein